MSRPIKIPVDNYQLVETCLQEQLPGGTVRCGLCSWRCKLSHGQRGFCQAHVNRNGTLYNLSYGIISSIDVNPIEPNRYAIFDRVPGALGRQLRLQFSLRRLPQSGNLLGRDGPG